MTWDTSGTSIREERILLVLLQRAMLALFLTIELQYRFWLSPLSLRSVTANNLRRLVLFFLLDTLPKSTKRPGASPAFVRNIDESAHLHSTRLLSFTFSASRYTLEPISLNLALMLAMPSSMVPEIDRPTLAGSFKVAA